MTLKTYPRYKAASLSWLEDIPSHWNVEKSKYLFRLAKRAVREEDGIVTAFRDGMVTLRSNRRTDGFTNADKEIGYQGVRKGDLVIHAMDAFAGAIGVSDSNGKCSPVYSCCIPLSHVDTSYYARLVRTMSNTGFIQSLAKGIRERSTDFRWSDFRALYLPVPPLAEQKAIAIFLDRETQRIDSLIEEKQTFIKLLKEKRQALISHVVTKGLNPNVEMQDSGIEWIGQVPEHWVVKKIKYDVLGIEQGWSPQCESTPVPDDHTWGVVKVGCVNRGIFNPEQNKKLPEELEPRKEYTIKKGDLLVSRANAKEWVGSAAVPDRDYDNLLLCDKIYRIKLDLEKADPEFFAYYLASDQAREQIEIDATGTSSSMLNIGQGTILNMPIPAPELPEQQSIVQGIKNKTSQIDRLMLEVLDSIELLKEHRTSLISAAVTGKIDVREAV